MGFKYYSILVNFEYPDGSTSWGHINYDIFSLSSLSRWQHKLGYICHYILVIFDSPDGSTYWGLKYYYILVTSGSPDGSTYGVLNIIIV